MLRFLAILFAGLVAAMFPYRSGHAHEIGFAEITIGDDCATVRHRLSENSALRNEFVSAITLGRAYSLYPYPFGFDWVQDATVICNQQNTVAAIALTIPKREADGIADALSSQYRQLHRHLPRLGAGRAVYQSASGLSRATINYVHVSFTAELIIESNEFQQMHSSYIAEQNRREEEERQSAF